MDQTENTPLISVIIPAYNAEQTIRRACDSVLSQTYTNVELIVVDDGSRDATAAQLDEIAAAHGNMRSIHQENGGVCKARNTGIEQAAGTYIAFLDADDEMRPECLSRMYSVAAEYDCDVVAGNFTRVYEENAAKGKAYVFENSISVWEGKEALARSLKDHPATYAVWGKLYRKAAVADVRFVEGKRIQEDSFFLFELFLHEPKMVILDEILINHYMTKDSASRSGFSEKFLDILYFSKRKYEIIEEQYPEYLDLARNVRIKASLSLLNAMRTSNDPQYKDVQKECFATVRENAKYFIPAIPLDQRMFWIVRLRLYWLYKLIYKIISRLR